MKRTPKRKLEKEFNGPSDHLCVIRHKSVSLTGPISCVWNKKVILVGDGNDDGNDDGDSTFLGDDDDFCPPVKCA